jgi:hypothetical protein
MAIVQISKIIHRTGAQVDLPQLDTGEISFSTDTRQVFIGNDPILYPPDPGGTTQTEILTDQSSIDFARLNGSNSVSMLMESPESGQLLGIGVSDGTVVVTNLGGNAVTTSSVTRPSIDLGDIANIKITGEAFNGAILQTDGAGNLSWTTNGLFRIGIANISKSNPAVVTTQDVHYFGTGASVVLYGYSGMTQLLADGDPAGSGRFWIERLSDTTFSLYEDEARTSAVNSSTYAVFTANTGYAWGGIPATGNAATGGSDTQVQFNDAGGFAGSNKLVFDQVAGNLTATGNIIVNTGKVFATTQGSHIGPVGATSPNTGAFTSITASTTIVATGNITANNITAISNGSGNNFKVGDDAFIGDVNISDTIQLKGVANAANAYMIFGTGDTTKLGRSGTGPLTYGGNVSITGNLTANVVTANRVALSSWSMFANVDGLFATDGANTYSINMTQL